MGAGSVGAAQPPRCHRPAPADPCCAPAAPLRATPGAGGQALGSEALAAWFDALNDTPEWAELLAERPCVDVISASHFLPHQALLPEKRYL